MTKPYVDDGTCVGRDTQKIIDFIDEMERSHTDVTVQDCCVEIKRGVVYAHRLIKDCRYLKTASGFREVKRVSDRYVRPVWRIKR